MHTTTRAGATPAGVVCVSISVPTVLTLVVETAPPGAVVEVIAVRGAATAMPQQVHTAGQQRQQCCQEGAV
jgi:hypothetical protein